MVALKLHLYKHDDLTDGLRFQRKWSDPKKSGLCHHGLHYSKFFAQWLEEGEFQPVKKSGSDPADPVLDWLATPSAFGTRSKGQRVERKVGDPTRLTEAAGRLQSLAERFGATFELDLVSRLLTGIGLPHPTENGFLFHPTLAVPYLRGTALKQVARDRAEECDAERIDFLFGAVDDTDRPKSSGHLAFLDALPTLPVTLTAEQISSHYPDYYGGPNPALGMTGPERKEPADWYEPIPVTLLAVDASFAARLPFRFGILALRGASKADVDEAAAWLHEGLEWSGVGAKSTLGYGRFIAAPRLAELNARRKQLEEQNWRPTAGEDVLLDGETVRVVALLPGDKVRVDSIDAGGAFDVERSELKRRPD